MSSPYLDRPLVPLAVALPRMLETIEAELATADPDQKPQLRWRAELIRDLLAPTRHDARDQGATKGDKGSPTTGLCLPA
jgi:hypothetical protein